MALALSWASSACLEPVREQIGRIDCIDYTPVEVNVKSTLLEKWMAARACDPLMDTAGTVLLVWGRPGDSARVIHSTGFLEGSYRFNFFESPYRRH